MHGIPVAVKDQLWTKGMGTTFGSRLMADFSEEYAIAVANLKKAGAILHAKPISPSSQSAASSATVPIVISGTWAGSLVVPVLG